MINIYTSYYKDKNPERQKELLSCLEKNIANKAIGNIYLYVSLEDIDGDIIRFRKTSKVEIVIVPFKERPTYLDFFKLINKTALDNDISILCNSDIYFNSDIANIEDYDLEGLCLALSRYDIRAGEAYPHHSAVSQDVWIFKGKVKQIDDCYFYMGIRGCDNRIALLISEAGYKVYNPCKTVKCYHLHESGVRTVSYNKTSIPGPYLPVFPMGDEKLKRKQC